MIFKEIAEKKPELIFVGMGSPLQEKWIAGNLSRLNRLCAVGVGGSLDVIAGNLSRAPLWMRRAGLEWMFRFLQEPFRYRKIWKLPIFLLKVIKSKIA